MVYYSTEKMGKNYLKLFLLLPSDKGFVSLSTPNETTLVIDAGKNLNLVVYCEAYPKPEEQVWMYMNETLQNSSDHSVRFKDLGNNR